MEAIQTLDGVGKTVTRDGLLKPWLQLLLLQALVAGLVLAPFIDGSLYFAFLDIGSDTYVAAARAMNLARLFAREGFTGWSFNIGLGAPVAFAYNDLIGQLAQLGGAAHVLELRIWVYLLKIALGGGFFFVFSRGFVRRREPALLAALAYSFCGYIVVNGQWDSETNIFVFAPLVLWGLQRYLREGDRVVFPLAIGAMLLSGVFFVLVAVSLLVACGVCVAVSEEPRSVARKWAAGVLPLACIGFLIGAPSVLPVALQLMDSPRIGQAAPILSRLTGEGLVSGSSLLISQLGGLFHKDIFGIGGMHYSYMNYLESPGFYAGVPFLLLAPQLWSGGPQQRRVLVVGLVATGLYMLFPVFRLAAFGFAVPYFRGTTLWVTIGILVLGSRAADQVIERGVDLGVLWMSAAVLAGLLGALSILATVSPTHVVKMFIFVALVTALLAALGLGRLGAARLAPMLLALLLVELVTTAWPSYYVLRSHVRPDLQPYNDATLPALAAVRADNPPAFYRTEKTYSSFEADSLAQDYMGVRSYYYHGRAVVRFHEAVDLTWQFSTVPVNATNWLPAPPAERFLVASALGVRYLISRTPVAAPGLERIASGEGYLVYRNALALPLGVVHTRQIDAAELLRVAPPRAVEGRRMKDLALVSGVVLDRPLPQWGRPLDAASLAGEVDYERSVRALQRTGLEVSSFSNSHITGTIHPDEDGILVFSIPAYRGWSLHIDGEPVDLIDADFGMLAAPVRAGTHAVELRYALPGLAPGLILGALGLLALWLRPRWPRVRKSASSAVGSTP